MRPETYVLWLHIAAIVVWVGGLFAVSFVLVPVLRRGIDSQQEVARLVTMVLRRFQRISRELILLILLTGMFNLISAGVARGFNFSATYIVMLVIKVTLFVVMVAIQAWQGFRLAPAFASLVSGTEQTVVPGAVKRLRRRALATSMLNMVLAATAILLGLGLRYR